jgi:ABC-type transporter Mla subunit MlaD
MKNPSLISALGLMKASTEKDRNVSLMIDATRQALRTTLAKASSESGDLVDKYNDLLKQEADAYANLKATGEHMVAELQKAAVTDTKTGISSIKNVDAMLTRITNLGNAASEVYERIRSEVQAVTKQLAEKQEGRMVELLELANDLEEGAGEMLVHVGSDRTPPGQSDGEKPVRDPGLLGGKKPEMDSKSA